MTVPHPPGPDVTLVMPVLNGAAYLREAVDSVLGQTHGALALVVVDDGSTDATPGILAAIEDPRLRVITHPRNRGRTAAVATGLTAAGTEYVGIANADDILLPTHTASLIALLRARSDVDVVSCQLQPIDEHGDPCAAESAFPLDHASIAVSLLHEPVLSNAAVIGRAAVMRSVPYDAPFDVAEDYWFWTRLLLAGARFANHPEALHLYRQHPGQSTVRERREMDVAHRAVQHHLLADLHPGIDPETLGILARWAWHEHAERSPSAMRVPGAIDDALRATRYLVDHPVPELPRDAVRGLRRRVLAQDLVAWGATPSWRAMRGAWSELSPRERLVIARRMVAARLARSSRTRPPAAA